MILLDTNVAIAVLRDRPPKVRHRLRAALEADEAVAVPSVVLFELRHGAARSADPARNHARIDAFLGGRIDVLPLDALDAAEAGELRAALERAGLPIGPGPTHEPLHRRFGGVGTHAWKPRSPVSPFGRGSAERPVVRRSAAGGPHALALPIGAYDLLIAAQARRRGARLVTHNTREFGRVEGLALDDWEAG